MTDKNTIKSDDRIHYLYRITNIVNGKIYIGQTIEPTKRWYQHRRDSANPTMVIHHAINKYGAENFKFEVIASCKSWEDANETETFLVSQYNSLVENGKGYNVALGGYNAPKSEAWKEAFKEWHESLSSEERAEISKKQSEATKKQIETKGHPAQGTKRTPEQIQNLIQARKDNPVEYTEEKRKNMSEAHIGLKDSEETKKKKSESIKLSWEQRHAELIESGELKCNAPDCDVSGPNIAYLIVNNVRYCSKHGQRLNKNGTLEISTEPWNKGIKLSEEDRKKCGTQNIGRVPVNKIKFTEEQIAMIMADPRSNEVIAKDLGYGKNAIQKLRRSIKLSKSL